MGGRTYIAIDLKSFYASVECRDRGLDPLNTNLVVADKTRTAKTICLAVTPPLKARGIAGRPRLFEVEEKVRQINAQRRSEAPGHRFRGRSHLDSELRSDPGLELDYVVAPPRMAHYVTCSAEIYQIYLQYAAPEDIHVYSIDEVFIDATHYLGTYGLTARELAQKMILDVFHRTGITATAGIGPNLYLCKTAMDIVAKHIEPDENGVRIAALDEMSYRRLLWGHRPLTDFGRVGKGYAKKLEAHGLYTMGDIARCSVEKPGTCHSEELLYRLFGVNAELLIDHAWGWEPCTMEQIHAYRPAARSVGSGQVLQSPYDSGRAKLVVREMTDQLALDLVDQGLVTDQLVLTVGYDVENLLDDRRREAYQGAVSVDAYGRSVPKAAHGTRRLDFPTASACLMTEAMMELFDRITDPGLLVRRLTVSAGHVVPESEAEDRLPDRQLTLFEDCGREEAEEQEKKAMLDREKKVQHAVLNIKKRYGKNAILKGMNLEEGATAREKNEQIGGHRA